MATEPIVFRVSVTRVRGTPKGTYRLLQGEDVSCHR